MIFSVLVSIATYFHFQLNHRFNIIENWVFEKSWELVPISKLAAAYIIYKFMQLRVDSIIDLRKYWHLLTNQKPFNGLNSILFVSLFILYLGSPEINLTANSTVYTIFISFIGTFIYFFCDFFIITYLFNLAPLSRKKEVAAFYLIILMITLFFTESVFPFAEGLKRYYFLSFLVCLFFHRYDYKRGANIVYFLLFFTSTASALFGLDPIWGPHNSPFKLGSPVAISHIMALIFIVIGYQNVKDGRYSFWSKSVESHKNDGA